MRHSLSAAVALAVGFGLASVGAQAHGMQHQSMQQHPQAARHVSQITKQVQQRLKAEGFYHGRIDGIVGPGTRQALANFQRQNNLRPTARLDRDTVSRLMGGGQAAGVGSTMPNQPPRGNFTTGSGGSATQHTTGPTGAAAPNPPPAAATTEPAAPATSGMSGAGTNGAGGNMPSQAPSGSGGGSQ